MWIAGLKALIISGQGGRSKIDGWSDGGLDFDVTLYLPKNFLWLISITCFFLCMTRLEHTMVCSILNHNLVILVSLVNFENCPPACQLLGISKPIYIF